MTLVAAFENAVDHITSLALAASSRVHYYKYTVSFEYISIICNTVVGFMFHMF